MNKIQILSYNFTENILAIAFDGKRVYNYIGVSPYMYRKIDIALVKSNYSYVANLLKTFEAKEG